MSSPIPLSPKPADVEARPPRLSLFELFVKFLGFGLLAFGGPAAQIAMLKRELVEGERWISPQRFNRLLAVMQVLPGPEAHELCVHLGMRARGRWGGLVAGLGFMLPGFVLMMALAWLYFRIDFDRGWVAAALFGVQAAVIALIVRAVEKIGRHALTDRRLWAIAAACAAAALAGVPFWLTLPAAGLVHAAAWAGRIRLVAVIVSLAAAAGVWAAQVAGGMAPPSFIGGAPDAPGEVAALLLFLSGLKAGLLTFGGAYTAIPFLRTDMVGRGWLGDGAFLDGLALSGVLPAPLIIFSTFVGYVAGGPLGALAITAGIFLPAFAFSMIFYDRLETVVDDERLKAALEGVAAGVTGLIAVTAAQLGWGLLSSAGPSWSGPGLGIAIGVVSLIVFFRWKSPFAAPVVLAAAGALAVLAT
ncbi:chromate efflux transporter [Brevundimonas sp.]|uniref:chromate efflux transporter n=1 Tax=Brevundimonas sp. TaxID=1871086 RepID=UPI003D09B210